MIKRFASWLDSLFTHSLDECPYAPSREHEYDWPAEEGSGALIPARAIDDESTLQVQLKCHWCPKIIGKEPK